MKVTICLRNERLSAQVENRVSIIGQANNEWMNITICKDSESLYFHIESDIKREDLLILDTEIFGED